MIRTLLQPCLLLPLLAAASWSAELYPKGDVFPIGGFSPRPEEDGAAGFTLAGPTYGDSRALLKQCEALKMPMVYRVKASLNVKRSKEPLTPEVMERLREEIGAEVASVASSEQIHSWAISPEELRYWRSRELDYLKMAVEAIHQADPNQRPIWMYEPGHRAAKDLARLLPYMGISAKGTYTNYSSRREERAWVRQSIAEQRSAIAQGNPKALLFALPEMFQEPEGASPDEIRSWVRHDVYSSLLEGAQGVLIYSFAKRRGFHSRQSYYDAYAEVARELNGPLQLGPVFLRGTPLPPPSIEHLSGPEQVTLSARPPQKDALQLPAVQAKAYAWNRARYLFLLNSANLPVVIHLKEEGWLPLLSAASGEAAQPTSKVALPPYEVVILQRPNL